MDLEAKVFGMAQMSIRTLERIGSEMGSSRGSGICGVFLRIIRFPLLMLIADKDSVIDMDDRRWLEELGDRLRVRTISGAGHSLHRSHLALLLEKIRRFEGNEFLARQI